MAELTKNMLQWVRTPTWQEWLIAIGVAEIGSGMLGIQPAIAEQPIPVGIAQKLGIEPKEERDNVLEH